MSNHTREELLLIAKAQDIIMGARRNDTDFRFISIDIDPDNNLKAGYWNAHVNFEHTAWGNTHKYALPVCLTSTGEVEINPYEDNIIGNSPENFLYWLYHEELGRNSPTPAIGDVRA